MKLASFSFAVLAVILFVTATPQLKNVAQSFSQGASVIDSLRSLLRSFIGGGDTQTQVAITPERVVPVSTTTIVTNKIYTNPTTYVSYKADSNYVDSKINDLQNQLNDFKNFQARQTDAIYNSVGNSIGNISNTNISGGISDLSTFTTGDLAEGSNLYFTAGRVIDSLLSSASTTFGGDVYATTYYGDGSQLTGISVGSTFSTSTTRGVFSSSALGLDYSTSTGDLSLALGYEIPLIASTTEWANKLSSQWSTNGSNIYYNTGNVGIGTTSPGQMLTVGNNNQFMVTSAGTVTGTNFLGQNSAAAFADVLETNSGFGFVSGDPTISKAGNVRVRIGTTKFTIGNGVTEGGSGLSVNGNAAIGDGTFINTAAPTGGMIVQGNVGIGSTTPSAKLTVSGDSYFGGNVTATGTLTLSNGTLTSVTGTGLNMSYPGGGQVFLGSSGARFNLPAYPISDASIDLGFSNYRWRDLLLSRNAIIGGNVGIGTTSPSNKLEVAGDSYFGGNVTATGTLAVSSGITSGDITIANGNGLIGNQVSGSSGARIRFITHAGTTNDSITLARADGAFGSTFNFGAGSTIKYGLDLTGEYFGISDKNATPWFKINSSNSATNLAGDTNFQVGSSLTTAMTIASTTFNVGIGSTTPLSTLSVSGRAGTDPFTIASSSGQAMFKVDNRGVVYATSTNGYDGVTGMTPVAFFGSAGSTNPVILGKGSNGAGEISLGASNVLRINATNGLSSNGIINYSAYQSIFTGATNNVASISLIAKGHSTQTGDIFQIASSTGLVMLNMGRNGNLGIGSTTPSSKLSIHDSSGLASTTNIFTIASSTSSGTATSTLFAIRGNGFIKINQSNTQTDTSGANGNAFLDFGRQVNTNSGLIYGRRDSISAGGLPVMWLIDESSNTQGNNRDSVYIQRLSSGATSAADPQTALRVETTNTRAAALFASTTFNNNDNANNANTIAGSVNFFDQNSFNISALRVTGNDNRSAAHTGQYIGLLVDPTIKQSASAVGPYTGLRINVNETTFLGTDGRLFDAMINGVSKFTIKNNGNVGIGSTTPSSKLTVSGDTFLGGNVTATGTLALTGLSLSTTGNYLCIDTTTNQITSGTTCTLSSNRFKQNVQDLNLGLETVLALRPVTFNFKQGYGDNGSTDQLGFVAEEADAIDPRLVPHDKNGLASGFNYQNYTAVLTKAIQEQQVQINTLKNATTTNTTIIQQTIVTATSTEPTESFISTVASAVKNIISSAGDFVVTTIRSTLAIFDRVETKTAAVSQGLEMKDQATGTIYCVVIKNGEWDKKPGTCAEVTVATTTQTVTPIITVPTTPIINPSNPVATSSPVLSTSTPEIASSTPEISTTTTPITPIITPEISTSTTPIEPLVIPTPEPTPAPEVAPISEPVVAPEQNPVSVDIPQ